MKAFLKAPLKEFLKKKNAAETPRGTWGEIIGETPEVIT